MSGSEIKNKIYHMSAKTCFFSEEKKDTEVALEIWNIFSKIRVWHDTASYFLPPPTVGLAFKPLL